MSSFSRSLPILATAVTAFAHTTHPDHDPVPLAHVVVTAHPYARSQTELAQPTNVLSGRTLDLRQAPSLGELLAAEPGISSTWFGPGASRPIIRGLGGDRVRVLQNGIGTMDASVTSPDHAVALDPLLIERVEVVRGPASLLYGSSAVGGVVNVVAHRIHTAAPDQPLQGRLEARHGTANDEWSGGAVVEGGTGPFAWHLDGFRRRTKDVRIPGYAHSARLRQQDEDEHEEHHPDDEHEEPAHGRIPNTAIRSDGGAAGFSLVGERGYIGFAYSGFNSRYGIPEGGHIDVHHDENDHDEDHDHDHDEEGHEHGPVEIDLRQRRFDIEGEWRLQADLLRAARFRVSRSHYRHHELEDDEIATRFTNHGYEGRFELLHEPIAGFTGALGAQASRERFSAVGEEAFLPPSRTERQGLFLFEEAVLSPVTWQLGARVERQQIELRDDSGRGRRDRAFSVSTGLVWPLQTDWSLAAAVTRTQRPPNAQELYSDGPHIGTLAYEIGDDALGRERSLGVDVSLRRTVGTVSGSLTVFANRFDNFIFAAPTGDEEDGLDVYRYLQRDARFTGAELELVFHLHEAQAQMLDLTVAADIVRGRNLTDGTHLPRVTPPRVRTGLDWRSGAWSVGAEAQRVFRQEHVAPEEWPTDSYTLYSAYAGYRFTVGTALFDLILRGTNLTNREARVHTSYLKEVAPLPGRHVSVALRLSF
jgi:iron complex outermembrane recepter protein